MPCTSFDRRPKLLEFNQEQHEDDALAGDSVGNFVFRG